ncbi:MAG: glutamate--tRNA ligase [Oscillospiraceae bacterium]
MSVVKTRFAPSPTGFMHIGNLRTALYSYLLAKSNNGKFILRIEDTDQERLVEGAVDVILSTLKTTGITYDEGPGVGGENGPYIQSERKDIYMKYAKELVEKGQAYYCFCTKERLESLQNDGEFSAGYDRHCRDLPKEEVERNLAEGKPFVIRQKMPLEGVTSYEDAIFGHIEMDNSELQDQILMKADGFPTYNFCHIVDDHLMGVTHVVRGSEYLTSTPKYVLLYDAFGWERPVYCHLPLLMGKDAEGNVSKLSKRHGAVSFEELCKNGYLPEAIINYIAFLGWCPKDTNEEFFTLPELEKIFSIDGISKSPAVFDYDKLLWFNSHYIKALSPEKFMEKAKPYFSEELKPWADNEKLCALIQSRIDVFPQVNEKAAFVLGLPEFDAELYVNKKNKTTAETAKTVLDAAVPLLENTAAWDNDSLFELLKGLAETLGLKAGAVMWVVRIAVSGMAVTPGGATELMTVLGKDESIARLKHSLAKL